MTSASISNPASPGKRRIGGRLFLCALTLAVTLGLGGVPARAMPSAPAGVSETGAPSFVVLGPEALGLSTAPIDLHLLPDGRILVVAQHELAFGDGVRWEAFRGAEGQPPIFASVAVDHDGQIYIGIEGGFARFELSEGARWHLAPVVKSPVEAAFQNAPLVSVAAFSDRWYWYGGNGSIVSWRPGQTASIAGNLTAIERIFTLGKDVYVSDQSSGGLFRLKPGGNAEKVLAADTLVSESVTCAVPFGPGQLLVGTGSAGLKLFDGKTFRPFGPPGLLSNGHRITDLCSTGEGFFAASVDTVGIVFFDREGRMVQVLDRSLDHRLARVQLLQYAPNGVLWALLNDSVARVEFPSPISHYEPLLASGLAFAQPLRHAGQLWVIADGRAMHGIYDASGRLERFTDDTPPGRYLFTLTEVDGQLFATNDEGAYVYETTGWRLVLSGIVDARIGVARSTSNGIFYVARGEYGMVRQTGRSYTTRRILLPDLGDSFNSEVDSVGIGWLELGMNRIGRLDPHGEKPVLQIFGPSDGLSGGWVELYLLDGVARFHVNRLLYRFDDIRRRFVEDRELLGRLPQLAIAGGRPTTDSFGRLWYTLDGVAQVIDRSVAGGNRPVKIAPVGFAPTSYTTEDDGVIWMFEKRRLARMDLRLPPPPDNPLRALITSVQFSASSRQIFAPGAALEPLNYADNSLVIRFAAPANPFASPITFEVLLEGAGTQWVSTGAVGSATFNRLKEGDYVFRVRPVAGGTERGAEDRLAFTVRPPWFRTPLAWGIYIGAAAGLFVFAAWISAFLQRRENERLEQLVAKRTVELNATNAQLGHQIEETTEKSAALSVSEERFRLLNTELEDRVQRRTAELEQVHRQLLETSRHAGMAEVATGVLHNVGNVLNSVNVSATLVSDQMRHSKTVNIAKLAALIEEHKTDLAGFLTKDPRGLMIPGYLTALKDALADEQKTVITELDGLRENVEHIKNIVAMQQAHAGSSGVIETVSLADLVEDALRMNASALVRHDVNTIRDYQARPLVSTDRHKVMQIVINLVRNAKHACDESVRPDKQITVRITGDAQWVRIAVIDNGVGIPAENLTRIFNHGFTTRKDGHGFGLHSGALAARELGGALLVHSDGPDRGAVFTLELPVTPGTAIP